MVFDKRIKIGVVGVGYLGCIHIQKLLVFKEVKLSGILDANNKRAKEIGKKYELGVFTELIDLAKISDAILAGIASFLVAYLVIWGMMAWLKRFSFTPFVIYRVLLGIIIFIVLF